MIMAQTRMAVRHHQTSRRLPRRRREPAAEKRAPKSRNRTRKHAGGWVIFKMSKRVNFSVLPAEGAKSWCPVDNGEISFDSRPSGTRFYVRIPMVRRNSASHGKSLPPPKAD